LLGVGVIIVAVGHEDFAYEISMASIALWFSNKIFPRQLRAERRYHWIMPKRRFPPPWSIDEQTESFIVKDATGLPIAYVYFEDEPQRQMSMKRLSRDEAFLVAVNIAKLPSVPQTILKDIPRPPHSAGRDDWRMGRILAIASAVIVALLAMGIAHDGFGIPRDTIRNVALIGAALFCVVVAGVMWLKRTE
jgi:hypothetical protein